MIEIDSDRHERIRTQYYNGLDWGRLNHDARYRFIFMIEAAAYCETHNRNDMRRVDHERLCDQALNRIPSENRDSFGGTYQSIYNLFENNPDFQVYLKVKKAEIENGIQRRNTRIIPHITEIKQLVESTKTENTEMRVLKRPYDLKIPRSIFEPLVKISDNVTRSKGAARTLPTESVSISDRVSIVVTRAKPKEKKRNK